MLNVVTTGHNSKAFEENIMEIIAKYSESLERSHDENEIRKELRERAKEEGVDPTALQNSVSRLKASLKKREGYDESMETIKRIADEMGGAENIFAWYVKKEEAKKKAKEEKELTAKTKTN